MPRLSYTLDDIESAARFILKNLKASVLLFEGEMGSGKTTLIKELVKQLGSSDEVVSPTFSIINEYAAQEKKIYHFDLYRLKNMEEAYDFGVEEYLDDPQALVLIEWPAIIAELLSENSQKIRIIVKDFQTREVLIN